MYYAYFAMRLDAQDQHGSAHKVCSINLEEV